MYHGVWYRIKMITDKHIRIEHPSGKPYNDNSIVRVEGYGLTAKDIEAHKK